MILQNGVMKTFKTAFGTGSSRETVGVTKRKVKKAQFFNLPWFQLNPLSFLLSFFLVDGDFEDLETGEVHKAEENGEEEGEQSAASLEKEQKELQKKREELKRKFIEQYDQEKEGEDKSFYDSIKEEISQQLKQNREEFAGLEEEIRAQLEGYYPGTYVRVVLNDVPYEFIQNFDPAYPLLIGGLLSGEDALGLVQVISYLFLTTFPFQATSKINKSINSKGPVEKASMASKDSEKWRPTDFLNWMAAFSVNPLLFHERCDSKPPPQVHSPAHALYSNLFWSVSFTFIFIDSFLSSFSINSLSLSFLKPSFPTPFFPQKVRYFLPTQDCALFRPLPMQW